MKSDWSTRGYWFPVVYLGCSVVNHVKCKWQGNVQHLQKPVAFPTQKYLFLVSTLSTETRSLGLAIRKCLYASGTSRPCIRVRRVGRALFREAQQTMSECCSFSYRFWLAAGGWKFAWVSQSVASSCISVAWKRELWVCGFGCSAINMLVTPYTRELRDFNEPSGHLRTTRRPSGSLKSRSFLKRSN